MGYRAQHIAASTHVGIAETCRHNANIGAIKSFMVYMIIGKQRSTTTSRALQSSSPQMMTHGDTSATILFEPDTW